MTISLRLAAAAVAVAVLAACQTDGSPGPTTTATSDASVSLSRVSYQVDWTDGRSPFRKLTIPGTLRLPQGATGKIPAVVLLHSYGGIDGTGHGHAVNLNAAGFATLEIDMFGPRGQAFADHKRVLPDVFGALNFLAAHPAIDPERIAVAGYSYGGILAMLSLSEGYARSFSGGSSHRFAAHIAYYPVCYFFGRRLGGRRAPYAGDIDRSTGRPLLIIAGAKDEYEGPDTCEKLKESLSDATRSLTTVHTYPDAGHGFDVPHGRSYDDSLACFGNGCRVNHFRNAEATADAYRREVEFLRKAFALEPGRPSS
jgi:dienelactone hydrolase